MKSYSRLIYLVYEFLNDGKYSAFTKILFGAFQDAKKDESVRRAYKHLAALHEVCNDLEMVSYS